MCHFRQFTIGPKYLNLNTKIYEWFTKQGAQESGSGEKGPTPEKALSRSATAGGAELMAKSRCHMR